MQSLLRRRNLKADETKRGFGDQSKLLRAQRLDPVSYTHLLVVTESLQSLSQTESCNDITLKTHTHTHTLFTAL